MPRTLQEQVDRFEFSLSRLTDTFDRLNQRAEEALTGGLAVGAAGGAAGGFPQGPFAGPGGSVDIDLGAGTLTGRAASTLFGGAGGSFLGAATSPIAPFVLGAGILASGYGDEVIEYGARLGGAAANRILERAPEIGAAIVSGITTAAAEAVGSTSRTDLILDALVPGRVTREAREQFGAPEPENSLLQRLSDFLVPPAGAHPGPEPHTGTGGGIRLPTAFTPSSSGIGPLARGVRQFSPGSLGGAFAFFNRAGAAGREFQGIGDDSTAGRLYGRLGRSLEADVAQGVEIAGQGEDLAREAIDLLPFMDRLEEKTIAVGAQFDGLEQGLRSIGDVGGDSLRGLLTGVTSLEQGLGAVVDRIRDVILELTVIQPFENFLTNLLGGFAFNFLNPRGGGGPGAFGGQFDGEGFFGSGVTINQTINDADPSRAFQYTDASLQAAEEARVRGRRRVTSTEYTGR